MSETDIQLSSWAANISPSPTLAVDSKAKAMKAAGEDVCGFGAGEPDFDTPQFIKDACAKALAEGKTKYAPAPGLPVLRERLAEKYRKENGIDDVEAANVIVSPGGKYSCYLAILAVTSPGDEVIIPAPYWVSYPEMVKLAGGVPRILSAEDGAGFKITAQQLKEAITPKTRMVILNSPSNPTGAVYSKEELQALVDVALGAGIYIMSDEIYEYLLYDDVLHHIQSQTSSNATTFAQWGALAAMEKPDQSRAAIDGMLEVFGRRRLTLLEGLNSIDGITCERAQGAFYLFPDISALGLSANDFAARILESHKVAVVPGEGFGAPGFIRLSYATSDEVIEKGLSRLREFCGSL